MKKLLTFVAPLSLLFMLGCGNQSSRPTTSSGSDSTKKESPTKESAPTPPEKGKDEPPAKPQLETENSPVETTLTPPAELPKIGAKVEEPKKSFLDTIPAEKPVPFGSKSSGKIPSKTATQPEPPSAPAKSRDPWLDKMWSHKIGLMTTSELKPFIDRANSDPDTRKIISEGPGLETVVHVCQPIVERVSSESTTDDGKSKLENYLTDAGLTTVTVENYMWESVELEDILDPKRLQNKFEEAKDEFIKENDVISRSSVSDDFIQVYHYSKEHKVCIPPKGKNEDIYVIFVHEATHFAHLEIKPFLYDEFLKQYSSREDFVTKTLTSAGDELEAFSVEFSTQIKLDGNKKGVPKEVRDAYDDNGKLLDASLVLKYIEGPQFNYVKRYSDVYDDDLIAYYNEANDISNLIPVRILQRSLHLKGGPSVPARTQVESSAARLRAELARTEALKEAFMDRIKAEKIPTEPVIAQYRKGRNHLPSRRSHTASKKSE